jgi:Ca2+-binding EF-hand superfamily protein
MSVRQSLVFFSLAAFAVAGTASAQDRDQTFQERDRNNDGVLTQSEYGGHPGNFRSLDTDGDGVLSYAEFVRRGGRGGDERSASFADPFEVMDRNHDGYLTIQEYTGRDVYFRQMDRNGDGRVTRAEFSNEEEVGEGALLVRQFRTLDRNNDARLSRSESRMSGSEFARADYNRNGYITMDEYRTWSDRTASSIGGFDTVDRNNDGVISWGEWRSGVRSDRASFDRLDRNDDRVLTRAEYENRPVLYGGAGAMGDFRDLDRNNDGVLTRGESRLSSYEFDRADVNNDGVLTLKEYANTTSSENDQFDVLDRNNDGTVSRWEWNGNRDDFDRMDRNGDGVLSRSEFDRRSSGGFLGSILGRVEDTRFNELDVNNDGVVSPSEWRGSRGEFDRLDTNDDGVLNAYEFTR